jgi:predicted Zn-dependent protease
MATNHISADQQEALAYLFANPVTVEEADEFLKTAPPMPYGDTTKPGADRTIRMSHEELKSLVK